MPVWGPERPLTLLWVAVDDGVGGRALLGANETTELGAPTTPQMTALLTTVREEIVAAADERGLPIAWPLLDLEDLNAVTFTDVWGGFEDRIVAASTRYRADAVLIGRVRPGLAGNEVEWLFVHGVERQALPGRSRARRPGHRSRSLRRRAQHDRRRDEHLADGARRPDAGRLRPRHELPGAAKRARKRRRRVAYGNGTLSLRVAARGDARVLERVLALGGVLRPAAGVSALGSLTFEIVGGGAPP